MQSVTRACDITPCIPSHSHIQVLLFENTSCFCSCITSVICFSSRGIYCQQDHFYRLYYICDSVPWKLGVQFIQVYSSYITPCILHRSCRHCSLKVQGTSLLMCYLCNIILDMMINYFKNKFYIYKCLHFVISYYQSQIFCKIVRRVFNQVSFTM